MMSVAAVGPSVDRKVTISFHSHERSSECCEGDVGEYSGSPLKPVSVPSETTATPEESMSEHECKAVADLYAATKTPIRYVNQPSRSNSVSTHTSTASGYGQRTTRDSGLVDEASSSSISTSPLATATSTCSPFPSSGLATPLAEPNSNAGSFPSEEDAAKFLPPGLTTHQLWNFVVQVSKGKKTAGCAEKTDHVGTQRQEAARRALASASVSLNVAATAYGATGRGNEIAVTGEQQDLSNTLFDCALLDSSASRTETIGSRVGIHRRVQLRHRESDDCYARQYPQRLPPLPESTNQLPPALSGARVTRSTAKRGLSLGTSPAVLPKESSAPLLPAPKRRRGSQDSGSGPVLPCPPREIDSLLRLLAENARQVASAPDGIVPAALDCSFWKALQEQMNDLAKQERKVSSASEKHNCPPQFLSRLRVACSTCRASPQSSQNGKRRKREQQDPTRPGCPLPSPRCVPKFLTVPFAVYRVPTFRQCLCQWIASQAGTAVEALEKFGEGVSEDAASLQLPPRFYFSSRVTDSIYAEEEPRMFFSGCLPSVEEEADCALAQQDSLANMEPGQNSQAQDDLCVESSVFPSATTSPDESCKRDQTAEDNAKDGVYFDEEEGFWKAIVRRRNQVITKRFPSQCPANTVRLPHEVLYGQNDCGATASYRSLPAKHPDEMRATLYYDWASKHFKEVCKYLESVPGAMAWNRGLVTTSSIVDRPVPLECCAMERSSRSAISGASSKSSAPLSKSGTSYTSATSSRKQRKGYQLDRYETVEKLAEASNQLRSNPEVGKMRDTKKIVFPGQNTPPAPHVIQTDVNEQQGAPVCGTSTIARQFVLRQCQRLLATHRQQLSDQLSSQNTTSLQSLPVGRGNTLEGPSLVFPGERANPKGPSQAHELPVIDDVMQRLQTMVRDTLGTLPAPSAEAGVTRYQQQLLLLQQMRQHHLEMQRLVINTASSAEMQSSGVPPEIGKVAMNVDKWRRTAVATPAGASG